MTPTETLARLADAATPGPWEYDEDNGLIHANAIPLAIICDNPNTGMEPLDDEPSDHNARLMAAANPSEIKSLLARIESLEERNRMLEESLSGNSLGEAVIYWLRAYDELRRSDDIDANCEVIRVPKSMIPKSGTLIEAYETDSQYVILGDPGEDESHNCDGMGCTTFSHVVARIRKADLRDGWVPKINAILGGENEVCEGCGIDPAETYDGAGERDSARRANPGCRTTKRRRSHEPQ